MYRPFGRKWLLPSSLEKKELSGKQIRTSRTLLSLLFNPSLWFGYAMATRSLLFRLGSPESPHVDEALVSPFVRTHRQERDVFVNVSRLVCWFFLGFLQEGGWLWYC